MLILWSHPYASGKLRKSEVATILLGWFFDASLKLFSAEEVLSGVGQGQASFLLVHAECESDPSASA